MRRHLRHLLGVMIGVLLVLLLWLGLQYGDAPLASPCRGTGWQPMASAPHETHRMLELCNTFGLVPWYGIYQYNQNNWQSLDHPGYSLDHTHNASLFWRPYAGTPADYTDPTGQHLNPHANVLRPGESQLIPLLTIP